MNKPAIMRMCSDLGGTDPHIHVPPPIYRFPLGTLADKTLDKVAVRPDRVDVYYRGNHLRAVSLSFCEAALLLMALAPETDNEPR